MRTILRTLPACLFFLSALFVAHAAARGHWRAATAQELHKIIPTRAPVIKENIETEFRTASGVTDGRGHFIAGVVMITAGYSAEGKYSHFFLTQVPLRIGALDLPAGEYVFGYQRTDNETIRLKFYRAANGQEIGDATAHVNRKSSLVRSLLITAADDGAGSIQIGRFLFDYKISE